MNFYTRNIKPKFLKYIDKIFLKYMGKLNMINGVYKKVVTTKGIISQFKL